jgi:hypothetical protein
MRKIPEAVRDGAFIGAIPTAPKLQEQAEKSEQKHQEKSGQRCGRFAANTSLAASIASRKTLNGRPPRPGIRLEHMCWRAEAIGMDEGSQLAGKGYRNHRTAVRYSQMLPKFIP